MQRRKFVIGMGALVSGAAAGIGTGAFTSVEADRDLEIEVVADNNAYLGLEGTSEYATVDGDGLLVLDFAGGDSASNGLDQNGDGLNDEAITKFEEVFKITNQGTQEVQLDISDDTDNDVPAGAVQWSFAGNGQIAPGDQEDVNVEFDLLNNDSTGLDGTYTLTIEATEV